jgi:hypothetical protein
MYSEISHLSNDDESKEGECESKEYSAQHNTYSLLAPVLPKMKFHWELQTVCLSPYYLESASRQEKFLFCLIDQITEEKSNAPNLPIARRE